MVFEQDVLTAGPTASALTEFVFAEEVEIVDSSERMHRFAMHGPRSLDLLAAAGAASDRSDVAALDDRSAMVASIAGVEVVVSRDDEVGDVGLHLVMDRDGAHAVWEQMLRADAEAGHAFGAKPIGWHAYNTARIEGGTPLFHVDFGATNLPGETGVLDDRVSFAKGCYLGQEVVARMQSLGHPKQVLVGLRAKAGVDSSAREWQPDTGAPVRKADGDDVVGAVTSSARSPMLGDAIVAFAVVKWGAHEAGSAVRVATAMGDLQMEVAEKLVFWSA